MPLRRITREVVHYLLVRDRLYRDRRRFEEPRPEFLEDIGATHEELRRALRPPKPPALRWRGPDLGRRRGRT